MRISTGMIYDKGLYSMQRQSSDLLHTQQQVSTGRRIVTPADDPIAAARVLQLNQSQSINEQFDANIGYANDNMRLFEGQLTGASDILQYVRERAVQAGNGALSETDRGYIAKDLRAQFDALKAIANSRDGQGNYIFAGYQADQPPFVGNLQAEGTAPTLPVVPYGGDQGERTIQVSASRHMPISLPGEAVFGGIFDKLASFISALEQPGAAQTGIAASVSQVLQDIDGGLENMLQKRAQIGSQLTETQQLKTLGDDLGLQYATTVSRLQDVDYAEAISNLTKQQTLLQAAQQSFAKISNLSLFNYIN